MQLKKIQAVGEDFLFFCIICNGDSFVQSIEEVELESHIYIYAMNKCKLHVCSKVT